MCGGGARNPNIINYLKEQLPHAQIKKLDETGVPSDAKEAVSFAQQALSQSSPGDVRGICAYYYRS